MGVRDARRHLAVRRIWESVTATVVSGLILWSVTSSMSQPSPPTERMTVTVAPAAAPPAPPSSPALAAATISPWPAEPVVATLSAPVSVSVPAAAVPLPKGGLFLSSGTVSVASILLYENFAHYREGDAAGWGASAVIKTGLDRRNWLVANVDGTHPVGYRLRLPNKFCFECRYSAYLPEVTRGMLGWWKEPVSTTVSLLNDKGAKYAIQWAIRCGNDTTRLNPLGSSSLYAKKCYHTITLPEGTANEVEVIPPTGTLRIDRDNQVVKVFLDGQAAGVGTMGPIGQLVGFQLDLVKAANGTLSFTEFKIAR